MSGIGDADKVFLLGLTRDIVAAYVAHNAVAPSALEDLISDIYLALESTQAGDKTTSDVADLEPAVPIEASVSDDHIICLEDGLPFKSLKRHIRSKYALSPDAYREKWKLPSDYPMVAPNYAKERSRIAKKSGLGRKRGDR